MRSTTPFVGLTAASALIATGLFSSTAAADAAVTTPLDTGCPAGWQSLSLSELAKKGYIFPDDLDANGDGYICGKPVAPAVQEMICETFPEGVCPVPVIYYIRDNNVTVR
jgi:hypothetical protein